MDNIANYIDDDDDDDRIFEWSIDRMDELNYLNYLKVNSSESQSAYYEIEQETITKTSVSKEKGNIL